MFKPKSDEAAGMQPVLQGGDPVRTPREFCARVKKVLPKMNFPLALDCLRKLSTNESTSWFSKSVTILKEEAWNCDFKKQELREESTFVVLNHVLVR